MHRARVAVALLKELRNLKKGEIRPVKLTKTPRKRRSKVFHSTTSSSDGPDPVSSSARLDALLVSASQFERDGNYAAAKQMYSKALGIANIAFTSSSFGILLSLARLHAHDGQHKAAITHLIEALERHSSFLPSKENSSNSAKKSDALSFAPPRAIVTRALAGELLRDGQFSSALRLFQLALSEQGSEVVSSLLRTDVASCLWMLRQLEEAEAALKDAPWSETRQRMLIELLRTTGRTDQAMRMAKDLVKKTEEESNMNSRSGETSGGEDVFVVKVQKKSYRDLWMRWDGWKGDAHEDAWLEAELQVGECALQKGDLAVAQRSFKAAQKRASTMAGDMGLVGKARAESGLGACACLQGRWDAGRELLRSALETVGGSGLAAFASSVTVLSSAAASNNNNNNASASASASAQSSFSSVLGGKVSQQLFMHSYALAGASPNDNLGSLVRVHAARARADCLHRLAISWCSQNHPTWGMLLWKAVHETADAVVEIRPTLQDQVKHAKAIAMVTQHKMISQCDGEEAQTPIMEVTQLEQAVKDMLQSDALFEKVFLPRIRDQSKEVSFESLWPGYASRMEWD